MPTTDAPEILSFKTPNELAQWLEKNHANKNELFIKMFKKGSGIPSVSWDEVVIESLCWGWIDGVKKSLDDQSYLQRITPRKARSQWSKRNTKHVERLMTEGRMQAPGLNQVRLAKADGRWDQAYSVSEMKVPDDFIAALEKQPKAKQFYATLTKANRYIIAFGLESAKKPETRAKRFEKFMNQLISQNKPV